MYGSVGGPVIDILQDPYRQHASPIEENFKRGKQEFFMSVYENDH